MSFKFTYLRQPLNRYTFKAPGIRKWIEDCCNGKLVLNLFAGPTRLRGCIEITNDIDPGISPTNFKMDALDCAKYLQNEGKNFDFVVLDPPYSYRKKMELFVKAGEYVGDQNSRFKQLLDVLPFILTSAGCVITFGYHSRVMSQRRGFAIREICLISHGGAQHDTIATIEERIKVTEKEIVT